MQYLLALGAGVKYGALSLIHKNINLITGGAYISQQSDNFLGGWSPSELEALAALLSVVLTTLIVLVYREQVKLKKLEQRPIIAAQAYKKHDVDSIAVQLKNYGHGSATQIQVRTIVAPVDARVIDTWGDRLVVWGKNRIPTSSSAYPVIKPISVNNESEENGESDSDAWKQPYGARMAPSGSGQYRVELSLKTNPNVFPDSFSRRWHQFRPWLPKTVNQQNPYVKTFGAAIEDLQDSAEHYRLRVLVRPANEFGVAEKETVFDYVIPAVDGLTIEQALDIGMPYDRFRNNREEYEAQTSE
ncbi:hypothetical protein [Halorientalis halophila]|uniref:hypothetical protein n=1 Tax=Halorientalis halophila TaxID=3108499 RepID=UPI00300BC357